MKATCINLTGRRFGKWLVLGPGKLRTFPSGIQARYWICRCDCGTRHETQGQHLRHGKSRQCNDCANHKRAAFGRSRSRRVGDGRTVSQIALATGVKLNTVYQRFYRGWKPWQLDMRPMACGKRRGSA
jgi:hypothetical protein